jgi:RNA polymerase sigma-32 factor
MPDPMQSIPSHDGSRHGEERALRSWLRTLNRLPRLSPDEERALLIAAQASPGGAAAATLLERHVYLAGLTALDFRFARYSLFDMVNDGIEGLVMAMQRFEVERGLRFSTYARFWVRARIADAVATHHGPMRFGTSRNHRKVLRSLTRAERSLRKQGLIPSAQLLARALGVTPPDVEAARLFLSVAPQSVEAPLGEEGSALWLDAYASDEPDLVSIVADHRAHAARVEAFDAFAETLSPREQQLWRERMVSEDPRTTPELAEELGVSRQRVSQVEGGVRRKLEQYILRTGVADVIAG